MDSPTDTYLFHCHKQGPLLTGSAARLENIIQSSKENAALHHQVQQSLKENPQTIKLYKSYTHQNVCIPKDSQNPKRWRLHFKDYNNVVQPCGAFFK